MMHDNCAEAAIRLGISQIIAGGESGWHLRDAAIRARRGMADPPLGKPMAIKGWTPRPDRIDWMRHLRDFCQAQGAAYFLKQWGGIIPDSAGRILHGEWSEQPRVLGDNGRWHDRRGSVKRVHPPRSLVNTYSQLRPAGGAMMVTLEALSLEADASTASHPFRLATCITPALR
jgi:Protein of unknown function (DUF5131)